MLKNFGTLRKCAQRLLLLKQILLVCAPREIACYKKTVARIILQFDIVILAVRMKNSFGCIIESTMLVSSLKIFYFNVCFFEKCPCKNWEKYGKKKSFNLANKIRIVSMNILKS